jgi:hypothetical protein
MVNPKISELMLYIKTAISCLTSENADTVFTQAMMDLAIQILLAVSCREFIEFFDDKWIYRLIRVVHRIPECQIKKSKLILKALYILKVICDHRVSQQILMFLKNFK